MTIARVRCEWAGTGVVGPALSTFYFSGSMTGIPAAVKTFFDSIGNQIPSGTSITTPSNGDELDEATGELTGAWTASGGGTTSCTGAGVFAAGAGLRVRWNTANVFLGRRVRGSTFIVPIVAAAYDSNGTIQGATVTQVGNAATALVTAGAGGLRVWSRPNALGQYALSAVTSATVPDKVSTLRSRRV